jgi:hypothetical protein
MTTTMDGVTTARGESSAEVLVGRIRAEYEEMPGLTLTLGQAARLWNRDARELERLLKALVSEGFLVRSAQGVYLRYGSPRWS